jgi:biotin carboxyl carrier protein
LANYKIQVNDKTYEVTVDQTDQRKFLVSIGDTTFECDSFRADDIVSWSAHRGEVSINARARSLSFDRIEVWLAGTPFQVYVHAPTFGNNLSTDKLTNSSLGEIRAAMPGRITSVLVKLNDRVEAGTPLLILESMKMQNEIISPITGRIKLIRVTDGMAVKRNALLIEID